MKRLKRSPFTKVVPRYNGNVLIYHSFFGNATEISVDTLNALELSQNQSIKYDVSTLQGNMSDRGFLFNQLIEKGFFIQEDINERDILAERCLEYLKDARQGKKIESISYAAALSCNFSCKYCMAQSAVEELQFKEQKNTRRLSFTIAKKALDNYVLLLRKHNKKNMNIGFGGGEPLLNWCVIKDIIKYCHRFYKDEFNLDFAINTNGSLISKEIASFCKELNVFLSLSLDGPPAANDKVRVSNSGKGTFEMIKKGWDNLKKEGFDIKGFYCTLAEENLQQIDESLVDFALEWDAQAITIEPDLTKPLKINISELIEKLLNIYLYALQNNIEVFGSWLVPVKQAFRDNGFKELHYCSSTGGKDLVILPDGKINTCFYTGLSLGHIDNFNELFSSKPYIGLIESQLMGNIELCRGCDIEGLCKGSCYVSRIHSDYDDNIMKQRCQFLKGVTHTILSCAKI